jgi:hypothetical protein
MSTPAQKVICTELSQRMLQALAKHKHTNYHFLFTGDEPWMFYIYGHRTKWVASWDDVDEIERRSHLHQTILFTIFFNGTGEYKIAVLPREQKMSSTCFIECVLRSLAKFVIHRAGDT